MTKDANTNQNGPESGAVFGADARPRESEIRAARELLADVLAPTPMVRFRPSDTRGDGPAIWLKPEIHQVVSSFKIRGVYHAVARMDEARRSAGLETVSAGNTAQALAWTGRAFGVEARAIMPDHAPQTKVDAVCALGGTPVLVPVAEVFRYLREHAWEGGPYAFVHPWTERDVWIGHATMGLEIVEELECVDTLFVPLGGGGLTAGVASALATLSPSTRIVAVEPEGCPSFHAARRAGRPVEVACDTMCDGVAVPYITAEMFPFLSELIDEVVLVSEADVRAAIRALALHNRIVAEGAGALALAAALRMPADERGVSVCPVTGGSIDADKLATILADV